MSSFFVGLSTDAFDRAFASEISKLFGMPPIHSDNLIVTLISICTSLNQRLFRFSILAHRLRKLEAKIVVIALS